MVKLRWLVSAGATLALLSLCLLVGQHLGRPGDCLEWAFSGVRCVAVSDDYIWTGFVLTVRADSRGAPGSWNDEKGYRRATTTLRGVRVGNALWLAVAKSEGEVALTGALSGNQLECTLVWCI